MREQWTPGTLFPLLSAPGTRLLLIKPESALGFVFGARGLTEMKVWCVAGMYMY